MSDQIYGITACKIKNQELKHDKQRSAGITRKNTSSNDGLVNLLTYE